MRNMDKYLEEFDKLEFESIQAFYRKRKFFEVLDTQREFNSVVEIGCGESSIFEFRQWHKNALIEPIAEFSDRLSKRINIQNIEIINSSLESCTRKHKFDLVVVSCLLNEISDKRNFMRAVARLMKPDSLLYIDVPNAHSMHRYLAVSSGYLENIFSVTETSRTMQQGDIVFSTESLCDFLTTCGFNSIDFGTNFVKFFHHARMAELVDMGYLTDKELDAFYEMQKDFPKNGSEIWVLARKSNG